MGKKIAVLVSAILCSVICRPSFAQQPTDKPAYKNPNLPVDQRADDLVSRMTLEEKASQLTNAAGSVPRLGIPEYNWWNEGLHGVARAGVATVFPQAIGMAATFDEPLMHRIGDVISTEFRASITRRSTKTDRPTGTRASLFGRQTSTFFAIPAGDAARRPTAKILISRPVWESRL